jgi:hypothetical protein
MPDGTTPIQSYQALVQLLDRESVMHETVAAEKSVYIPTKWNDMEGVQLIRWQDGDSVIQFIQSLPIQVPQQRVSAVESAVVRLNHALAWQGLDLNHQTRSLSFRLSLPLAGRDGVMPQEIMTCFRVALQTGINLVPTLRRITAGELSEFDAVADAQKGLPQAAGPAPQATGPTRTTSTPDRGIFQVD